MKSIRLFSVVVVIAFCSCLSARAVGFQLGKKKADLGLFYDLRLTEHGTGRVTLNLTLTDTGSLKPLNAIYLVVASKDGTGSVDLSVALNVSEREGVQRVRVHMLKEWAQRGEIQLRTSHLNGKTELLSWYYHSIPLADYLTLESHERSARE